MWRNIASNFLTLFVLMLVAAGIAVGWAKSQFTGQGPLAEAICLRVPAGANFRKVADDLAAREAIAYPYIFRLGVDYSGKAGALKAGSYVIPQGASMASIIDELTGTGQSTCGKQINYRIGVRATDIVVSEIDPATQDYIERAKFDPASDEPPAAYQEATQEPDITRIVEVVPGTTAWQVVDALSRADFLEGEAGAVPAEGMISPQQYEVKRGMARAELVHEMVADQQRDLDAAWAGRAEGLPYKDAGEALTMASLVEKETSVPAERAVVAGVFLNRLERGIRLETDPTVIYGLTKGKGPLGHELRRSELRSNTPYNTYRVDGLPPTPIANPGRAAIEAALHPATTNYIFFVADGTGGHVFAETLDEHQKNVAEWRKIQADQGNAAGAGQ